MLAKPNDGVHKALNFLQITGFNYCVSTTSPKPRVPVCVECARLQDFFPDEKIHSGQSDFDPPKYKPAPDVYLKAAEAEGIPVSSCIAIEDSVSGIGSAANADIALIVQYVGGSPSPRNSRRTRRNRCSRRLRSPTTAEARTS